MKHRNSPTHVNEMFDRKRRRDLRESSVEYVRNVYGVPRKALPRGPGVVIIGKYYPPNSPREYKRRMK